MTYSGEVVPSILNSDYLCYHQMTVFILSACLNIITEMLRQAEHPQWGDKGQQFLAGPDLTMKKKLIYATTFMKTKIR